MNKFIIAGSAQDIPGYDCRPYYYSEADLEQRGSKELFLGIAFIIFYILSLIAMLSKDLRTLSCYKIMITLGFYDVLAIAVNCLITGYFLIVGGWYCTQPDLNYISGSFGLGLWCGACMTCFVLVVNRLLDLWRPHLMKQLFDGKRTFFFLTIPIAYSIYFTMWTPAVVYNSERRTWLFDPWISEEEHQPIIVQTTVICVANFFSAVVYVYVQWIPAPPWVMLFAHISWQASHVTPAFVYIFMNKTIQREIKRIFLKRAVVISTTSASGHHHGTSVKANQQITPVHAF